MKPTKKAPRPPIAKTYMQWLSAGLGAPEQVARRLMRQSAKAEKVAVQRNRHLRFSKKDQWLARVRWTIDRNGYARRWNKTATKAIFAHHVVLNMALLRNLSPGECCDHINGKTNDNRRCNLRVVTAAQNAQNIHSKFRGTTWNSSAGGWQSQVCHNGNKYYLGIFKSRSKAVLVAKKKRRELGFLGD